MDDEERRHRDAMDAHAKRMGWRLLLSVVGLGVAALLVLGAVGMAIAVVLG